MNHKDTKKYELPKSSHRTMVSESPAALQQYADDLRYGMEVLSTVSPEKLHHIVIYLSDYTNKKLKQEPNAVTKAAILEARNLSIKDNATIQPVDTSSVEAMLSSCGI